MVPSSKGVSPCYANACVVNSTRQALAISALSNHALSYRARMSTARQGRAISALSYHALCYHARMSTARQARAISAGQEDATSLLRFGGSGNDMLTYEVGGATCLGMPSHQCKYTSNLCPAAPLPRCPAAPAAPLPRCSPMACDAPSLTFYYRCTFADLYLTLPYLTIPYHGICCRGHNRMRPVFGTSFMCALGFLAWHWCGGRYGRRSWHHVMPYHTCCTGAPSPTFAIPYHTRITARPLVVLGLNMTWWGNLLRFARAGSAKLIFGIAEPKWLVCHCRTRTRAPACGHALRALGVSCALVSAHCTCFLVRGTTLTTTGNASAFVGRNKCKGNPAVDNRPWLRRSAVGT